MTAEKTLKFAYLMRESIESRLAETGGKLPEEPESLNKFRKEVIPIFYPEYRKILDIIEECEAEISLAAAKAAGKTNEKVRTYAAKSLLKNIHGNRETLNGQFPTPDGIIFCNGAVAFKGNPIIGIPELPENNNEVHKKNVLPMFDIPTEPAGTINPAEIKARFKTAQAEFKGKKDLYMLTDKAYIIIKDGNGIPFFYDSALIVPALDLIGKTVTPLLVELTQHNCRFPMLKFHGECGTAIVSPFRAGFDIITRMIALGEIPETVLESAGFNHEGQWITNPALDPSGRFPLTEEEAGTLYGYINVQTFLRKVSGI